LQEGLENWLVDVNLRRKEEGAEARLVNRDGETIRESGFHVVSAWVGEHGLTSGQLKTEEKSNEIKAVPKLLEIVDVQGEVVIADAMSCQKEIARKIQEKGTDYMPCSQTPAEVSGRRGALCPLLPSTGAPATTKSNLRFGEQGAQRIQQAPILLSLFACCKCDAPLRFS
jgi:hypothetical protein